VPELAEIHKRLGAIERDVATLVERSSTALQRERDCRRELLERIDEHEELLRGNGRAGLMSEVAELRREARERALDRERIKRLMYSLIALVCGQLLLQLPRLITQAQGLIRHMEGGGP